jgi:hypothetical protein
MSGKITVASSGRKVTLKVGKEYVVQPLNNRTKKHRDRHCMILDFVPVSDSHPRDIVAKVPVHDNNRIGRVELGDLTSRASVAG